MPSISNILTNLYLLVTFSLFSYTAFIKYNQTQNYFAAALQMMDSPLTKLLLYNIVIAIAVITYKVTIFLFYEEVKANETLLINLIQKSGYKLFQLCFFLYAAGREFGLQPFVSMTIVFMMFIFHNIAISRASFLIHAHVSENMNLTFRLLAHFIILLFIDYEITIHTFSWLFTEGQNPSLILFAYYCITMSLTIIEPALNFFMHFYQSYTNCMIENLDINMMKLKFVINIPLLAFQLILSIILSFQLSLSFVLIFTIIQTINQMSAAVLDRLAEGPPTGQRWTLLKGNHESILAHLFSGRPREDESLYPSWLKHGGRETLASYGLPAALAFGDDEAGALGALREMMPRTYIELLESFELMRRAGDYLFVHAGIRPGVPVEEQRQRDLIWIREAFLEHKGDDGFHVVHGHSITRDVDAQANRTGIDTAAYPTGRLTAMVLEGDSRRFLSS